MREFTVHGAVPSGNVRGSFDGLNCGEGANKMDNPKPRKGEGKEEREEGGA